MIRWCLRFQKHCLPSVFDNYKINSDDKLFLQLFKDEMSQEFICTKHTVACE
jgi:hypothetical protein